MPACCGRFSFWGRADGLRWWPPQVVDHGQPEKTPFFAVDRDFEAFFLALIGWGDKSTGPLFSLFLVESAGSRATCHAAAESLAAWQALASAVDRRAYFLLLRQKKVAKGYC
ncbi:hypothetical protein VX159_02880 [Dechloromonas sp. ZY10]|uniref:hypothetical protein n=1 Tax=Dechloromonas aquae TaxID=2664436 RepID=UPI0035281953